MLKQRGYFTIETGGKKVILRFCTWTFKRFCELNGDLSLVQLQTLLSTGFSMNQFICLILCASEYEFVKKGEAFPYNDVHACEWIDDLGGLAGAKFIEMIKVVTESFTGNVSHEQKKSPKERAGN